MYSYSNDKIEQAYKAANEITQPMVLTLTKPWKN